MNGATNTMVEAKTLVCVRSQNSMLYSRMHETKDSNPSG